MQCKRFALSHHPLGTTEAGETVVVDSQATLSQQCNIQLSAVEALGLDSVFLLLLFLLCLDLFDTPPDSVFLSVSLAKT